MQNEKLMKEVFDVNDETQKVILSKFGIPAEVTLRVRGRRKSRHRKRPAAREPRFFRGSYEE